MADVMTPPRMMIPRTTVRRILPPRERSERLNDSNDRDPNDSNDLASELNLVGHAVFQLLHPDVMP